MCFVYRELVLGLVELTLVFENGWIVVMSEKTVEYHCGATQLENAPMSWPPVPGDARFVTLLMADHENILGPRIQDDGLDLKISTTLAWIVGKILIILFYMLAPGNVHLHLFG